MLQLIAHALGDYVLQSDWMAQRKTASMAVALTHATTYSIPFILLCEPSPLAWAVIVFTHAVIDRYRLAKYVVFAKNFLAPKSLWPKWSDCNITGYPSTSPPWLAVWLLIIADNTIHLLINYFALKLL